MKRIVVGVLLLAAPLQAQDTAAAGGRGGGRGVIITDTARARSLFVSKATADLAGCGANCDRDIRQRIQTDSAYAARAKGVMDFKLVTYKSRVDGLEIPAYLFAPLTKKATKHAALVWVHGGVHSNWGLSMWPFVKDAIDHGYVVIAHVGGRASRGPSTAHRAAFARRGAPLGMTPRLMDFSRLSNRHRTAAKIG